MGSRLHTLLLFTTLQFILTTVFWGQNRKAEQIINQKIKEIGRYEIKENGLYSFSVAMGYGSSDILGKLNSFKDIGATIDRIDLIYTDFPKGANLSELNLNRLKQIETFHPILIQNPLIKWNIVCQTACQTEEEARTFFHGIVIYYQLYTTPEYIKVVKNNLMSYLPEKVNNQIAKEMMDTMRKPVVNKVFNRNKNWENAVLIVDLTTSMIPYNSQVLLWQLLHSERSFFKDVILFNDGDSAPEEAKKVGKTGGIYHEKNISFDALRKTSINVCQNGVGNSDFPENDLEAVLFAINQVPNAEEYILIADNDAPPRDMALLDKINRPIRIVLCDTENGILPQYLEVARRTGGSVHTIDEDLTALMVKKEGEVFIAGGRKYKITGGKIKVL
jgi:hypothetical protein